MQTSSELGHSVVPGRDALDLGFAVGKHENIAKDLLCALHDAVCLTVSSMSETTLTWACVVLLDGTASPRDSEKGISSGFSVRIEQLCLDLDCLDFVRVA